MSLEADVVLQRFREESRALFGLAACVLSGATAWLAFEGWRISNASPLLQAVASDLRAET